jgi:nucleoside-diphosphate kinase
VERTLVILKPDAVQRGLIGQITARLEQRGLKLAGMKFIQIDNDLATSPPAQLSCKCGRASV